MVETTTARDKFMQMALIYGFMFLDGIPQYIATATYSKYCLVRVDDIVYISLVDFNKGNTPVADSVFWGGDLQIKGRLKDKTGYMSPVGSMQMFAGASTPDGFLLCNGSAINRTTYADLFAIIGENYGVGDGSTTFNLPDMRETYGVGVGTRGASVTAHDIFTLAQFKDDQEQGHYHLGSGVVYSLARTGTNFTLMDDDTSSTLAVNAKDMVVDGVNGTPRTGTTSRGKALGVNYIIKY